MKTKKKKKKKKKKEKKERKKSGNGCEFINFHGFRVIDVTSY